MRLGEKRFIIKIENIDKYNGSVVELCKDEDEYVRQAVAHNRATPVEVLDLLAKDESESEFVRERVVENLELRSG